MLKGLFKDSFFYGGFLVLSKLVAIIALPVLTKFFTPDEFNIADSSMVLLNFIVPFIFLGLDSSVGRYYNEYSDKGQLKELLASAFYPGLISALIVTLIAVMTHYWISLIFLNRADMAHYILLTVLNIPFLYIISFSVNILKYAFKRWNYVIIAFLNPVCFLVSVIVMGYTLGINLENYLLINLICNVFFAVFAILLIYKDIGKIPNIDFVRHLYAYGLPFSIVSLLGMAFSFSERLLLNHYYTPLLAGSYAFAYRIVNVIGIINRAFQLSWGPFSIARYKDVDASKKFNHLLLFMTIGLGCISLIVSLTDKWLIKLLGNVAYQNSRQYIPFLLASNTFLILSSISNIGINLSKKTFLHIRNYTIALTSLFVFFFLLKPILPNFALPIAIMSAYLILFIEQSISSNTAHKEIQFRWIPVLFITLSISLIIIIYKLL